MARIDTLNRRIANLDAAAREATDMRRKQRALYLVSIAYNARNRIPVFGA